MEKINITTIFPSQLSHYINNEKELQIDGNLLKHLIKHLETKYPDFKGRVIDENDEIRPYLNFFIGETNIKVLDGINSKLIDNDTVRLLLSRAGG